MVEVRQCSFLEFGAFRELPGLVEEYAAESAIDGMPTPRYHEANYLALERSGICTLLIATVGGVLVGFVVLLVTFNARYNALVGALEAFFVARAYRKSGAGLKLRSTAEQIAKTKGAVGILIGVPVGSKAAKVMERDKAYRETNRVFFRGLA